MKNRRILVVGSVIVIAMLVVLVFGFNHHKETRNYQKVTTNLQHSWLHGHDLYFSSGSFFAKYSLANGKIERLSDYLYIHSGVTALSWSTNAVVFQTNPGPTDRDDITTAATQLGVQADAPHWWRYDFTTKQYQLLNFAGIDSCTSMIQISDNLLACVQLQIADSSANQVTLFNISDKSAKKLASSEDHISDITSSGNTIFYVLTRLSGKQSLRSVSLSGSQDKKIYESDGTISYQVYEDGTLLVNETPATATQADATEGHTSDTPVAITQKIVLLRGQQVLLDKKINSLPVTLYADGSNKAVFSSQDGSISTVDSQGIHRISGPTEKPLVSGDFLFKLESKFWVVGLENTLASWPATPHPKNYRPIDKYDVRKDSDPNGNWWLDVADLNAPAVNLYLTDTPSSQQEAAVGDTLEKEGFWPSEFNFNWVVDGADYNTPISPKASIIQ